MTLKTMMIFLSSILVGCNNVYTFDCPDNTKQDREIAVKKCAFMDRSKQSQCIYQARKLYCKQVKD